MLRGVLTPRLLRAAKEEAGRRETPFFFLDPEEIRRQAIAWRLAAASEAPASILYPYKCNRHPAIIDLLAREGLGAEVTTSEDFRAARNLGLLGGRVVVAGPAKARELIDAAIGGGALFVADGAEDARAILARGRALSKAPAYLLRLAPSSAQADQRSFGLRAPALVALAREIARSRAPRPAGLAFHLGTGIASIRPYRVAVAESAEVGRHLALLGVGLSTLDVGGGFAARGESRLDEHGRPSGVGPGPAALLPELARPARRLLGPQVALLLEPGRALVSAGLHLVSRVVRVRASRGGSTVYLDASRLSHAFFVAHGRHPIAAIPRRRGAPRPVALAGPLGVGLDVFGKTRLPQVSPGDLVVIGSVGAYNWNAANDWAGGVPAVYTLGGEGGPLSRRSREAR